MDWYQVIADSLWTNYRSQLSLKQTDQAYHKISNIRRNKFQNLNDSRLVLHLYLPNLLKLGVK